ncbi:MAG: haloacid dehalogenase-like hydrolase [Coriobacteriia bacterium]|nr:haloacid dehalogenase-like hydrolase [Coriobacteriia bacterium]
MATLFLDYDGTLHETLKVYAPGFRAGYAWLVQEGYAAPQEFSDEWIGRWLGWTVQDMWETFMPELPEPAWREASHLVGQEMDRLTEAGCGSLFAGIPEALDALVAAGHTCVMLSNCGKQYARDHARIYGLDRWLSAYHTSADFPGLTKAEIYRAVKDAPGHPYPHVVVGDRFHDIQAAAENNIPSIACAFGYGAPEELTAATRVIQHPIELPTAVSAVLG